MRQQQRRLKDDYGHHRRAPTDGQGTVVFAGMGRGAAPCDNLLHGGDEQMPRNDEQQDRRDPK